MKNFLDGLAHLIIIAGQSVGISILALMITAPFLSVGAMFVYSVYTIITGSEYQAEAWIALGGFLVVGAIAAYGWAAERLGT